MSMQCKIMTIEFNASALLLQGVRRLQSLDDKERSAGGHPVAFWLFGNNTRILMWEKCAL